MKRITKVIVILLTASLMANSFSVALATGLENSIYTEEELQDIYNTNSKIEKNNLFSTRAVSGKTLSMTVVKQENDYYCGPATACMVAQTLGLGSYTQSGMANILDTTTSGSSSANIAAGLNSLLSKAGRTERYQKTDTSLSSLENSIPYCIERGIPLVVNVKEMPKYTVGIGHFIALNGYSSGFSGSSSISKVTICDPHPNYYGTYTYDTSIIVNACKSTKVDGQSKGNFCRLA